MAYLGTDFLLVSGNFLAAAQFRLAISGPGSHAAGRGLVAASLPPHYLGFLLLYCSLMLLFCHAQGLYRTPRTRTSWNEVLAACKATALATVLLTAVIYLSGVKSIPRTVVAASAVLNVLALVSWRVWKRAMIRRQVAKGYGHRNVLIVGAGKVGQEIATFLESNKHLGFVVKGFLDHNHMGDPRVMGKIEDLARVARACFVDEVIITIPFARKIVRRAIFEAKRNNLHVQIVPDLYGAAVRRATVDYLGNLPVMSLYKDPIPVLGLVFKRVLDIGFSIIGLAVLSPLLLIVAAVIRIDSPGPVLYRQSRVGKKGRIFTCYKFRTMFANADRLRALLVPLNQRDRVLFKIADDPRITRVGRFLRKYSIDELPQLWNVLLGDMSLVGPRPPVPHECKQYSLAHLCRLDVTPGITGLWQISARRDPSFQRYLELDLRYIENWSPWMDIKILFGTVVAVLQGQGQ